jgi:predicted GIY-YIG superfamily endonuclease
VRFKTGHKKTAKVCGIATDIIRDVEIHMKNLQRERARQYVPVHFFATVHRDAKSNALQTT